MTTSARSVIVIDDDDAIRSAVRRMLERAGYEVRDADDGAAGLVLQQQQGADLIVTDIYMPGQDGIQTIRQLRAGWPALKILAVSGGERGGPADLQEHALVLGASRVLAKPFDMADLLKLVRALIGDGERAP